MTDWQTYTIIGVVVVCLIFLIVLILKKKIVLGSIEITFPPKITFVPKGSGGPTKGSLDRYTAKNKGKIGNVTNRGTAENLEVTADGGEIGDVTSERKLS